MAYKVDVLIVGHSFVRHLKQLYVTCPEWNNPGMKRERHAVGFHGRTASGKSIATMSDMAGDLSSIRRVNRAPTVVVLDIGSNDLNNLSSYDPKHLLELILDVADRMHTIGVNRVAVVEMTYRKGKVSMCRDVAADWA